MKEIKVKKLISLISFLNGVKGFSDAKIENKLQL